MKEQKSQISLMNKSSSLAIVTALLAFFGASFGTYLGSRLDQTNWENRFDVEQKSAILHKRIELMEKTIFIFNAAPTVEGLRANIEAEKNQLSLDILKLKFPDEKFSGKNEFKYSRERLEQSAKEIHALNAELASVVMALSIYFGPETKKAIKALPRDPWAADSTQIQEIIDAMTREANRYDFSKNSIKEDDMQIPAAVYIGVGAVLAALVAGFFSFLNMVSSKENKVSEFRQAWIEGMRTDIAEYISGLQALIRYRALIDRDGEKEKWWGATKEIYQSISEAHSKIQLRINPAHAAENPESHEAKLLTALKKAQDLFSEKEYRAAFDASKELRDLAPAFLKDEWERVKKGEKGYQVVRNAAQVALGIGGLLFLGLAIFAIVTLASL